MLACCGVPTGWGIANDAGGVRAGDSVVGYGIGGGDDQGGHLKLDELVTNRYSLEAVNEGYQDLRDGKNIRGIVVHDAS